MCVSMQSARCEELHLHAENLSRRVWELLMLLPTCPKMLQAFQNISDNTVSPDAPHTTSMISVINSGVGPSESKRENIAPTSETHIKLYLDRKLKLLCFFCHVCLFVCRTGRVCAGRSC